MQISKMQIIIHFENKLICNYHNKKYLLNLTTRKNKIIKNIIKCVILFEKGFGNLFLYQRIYA